jgi:hypothetical protein
MNTKMFLLPLAGVLTAVLTIVLGLSFSSTVLSFAATAGGDTNIGSFSGTQNLNDLQPLLYYLILTIIAIGAIGTGAFAGFKAGRNS